jgi:hypothetical protein
VILEVNVLLLHTQDQIDALEYEIRQLLTTAVTLPKILTYERKKKHIGMGRKK